GEHVLAGVLPQTRSRAPGAFDTYDLCAVVGKHHRRERRRPDRGDLYDAYSRKRSRHDRLFQEMRLEMRFAGARACGRGPECSSGSRLSSPGPRIAAARLHLWQTGRMQTLAELSLRLERGQVSARALVEQALR